MKRNKLVSISIRLKDSRKGHRVCFRRSGERSPGDGSKIYPRSGKILSLESIRRMNRILNDPEKHNLKVDMLDMYRNGLEYSDVFIQLKPI